MVNIYIKNYYGKLEKVEVEEEIYRAIQEMDKAESAGEKKEMRRRDGSGISLSYIPSPEPEIEEILIHNEEIQQLQDAVSHLTPTQRKRVLMYAKSMTYENISNQESRCISVVYNSVQKALNHLKEELESHISE